ncbi:MAG: hypothetical protein NTW29_07170 [Bacteroidetes bacterium]|nr:hypothetical protein [Bacteroidota bacterium]
MPKAPKKKAARKLQVKKQTVSVLSDKSIVANLNRTDRPIIIISGGCATDFTRLIKTDLQKILMTDFTRPAK